MNKVLLTGASGFIGCALANHLQSTGHEVHVLVRHRSNSASLPHGTLVHQLDGSIETLCSILESCRPNAVVHLASLFLAEHEPAQVSDLIESNVLFGNQLLEAMRQTGVRRLLNTGTCWQHYGTKDVRPINLYAATKQAFDVLVDYYHDAYDISQVTLKLCDTYGPNDKRRKLVNILLQASVTGERLDMSPGEQILDLSYIDDIVVAYTKSIKMLMSSDSTLSERYLVSGSRHSLKEVVAIVERVTGRKVNANFGGRPYRQRELMEPSLDSEPLLPDWYPRYDLVSGLRHMLEVA